MSARYRRQSHGQKTVVKATAAHGSFIAVKPTHQYSETKSIGKIIGAGYHNGNG